MGKGRKVEAPAQPTDPLADAFRMRGHRIGVMGQETEGPARRTLAERRAEAKQGLLARCQLSAVAAR